MCNNNNNENEQNKNKREISEVFTRNVSKRKNDRPEFEKITGNNNKSKEEK